jgi:hypothetical protein
MISNEDRNSLIGSVGKDVRDEKIKSRANL